MDSETFNEVRIEDYIWIIYIFLAIFALVSNYYEKEYYKHIKRLDPNSSPKEILLANAGLIAALLFLIGGGISLFISIVGNDEDDFILNFF